MTVAVAVIKRYALVPKADDDGIRRFQLARVEGLTPSAERLERMEEVAARDRHGGAANGRPRGGDRP